ncbi:hypothetical protein ANN_28113 [Periplaneta americana]|uniref:Uncharacterized protein n=1 Tax=Periplaneta americana TaxID=6978 RepID=A0ABQ8RV32_PERAM|nr:hypothetical protein ANN_28113 [Periplaneta americana]
MSGNVSFKFEDRIDFTSPTSLETTKSCQCALQEWFHVPPNGSQVLDLLQEVLVKLCEDLPLALHQQMWFQHGGAPADFSLVVREHLHQTFGERW